MKTLLVIHYLFIKFVSIVKYGTPITSSHNGVHFVFRRPDSFLYTTVTFTTEGPTFVKQYDLASEYATNNKLRSYFSVFDFDPTTENGLSIEVQINNHLDVLFCVSKVTERMIEQSAAGALSAIYPKSNSNLLPMEDEEECTEVGLKFFLFYKG